MTTCPQCSTSASLLLHTEDYNRRLSTEVFNYYWCPTCKLIFIWPIPDDLGKYYPPSYYPILSTLEELEVQVKSQQYKVDLMQQFVAGGRLLEIGPGPGDFAFLSKRAGFDVDTIEMDERCCRLLRDVIGVNVVQSADTLHALQTMGQYDVIAMWHVIEHLPDPWGVLDVLADHIVPGGILVIAAPNPQAMQFRLFGRFWTHLDAPRHLELIPMQLLSQRLEKQGWQRRLMTTTDAGSLYWNRFGWRYSLSNLTGRKLSMRLLGAAWSLLVAPLERSGLRGSTYTAIYQR
jgi:protein-L-isoaspartate O-methyltransferase